MDKLEEISTLTPFKHIVSPISKNHLLTCPCQSHIIEKLYQKTLSKELKDFKGSTTELQAIKQDIYSRVLNNVATELQEKGVRCPLEKAALKDSISMFEHSHYDLNNPVVYNIVKNALSIELSSFRLQLLQNKEEVLRTTPIGENGYKWELNPLIESSRKASETIIKAMEILSRIVDGNLNKNLNVNVDSDIENIKKVWEKRKSK